MHRYSTWQLFAVCVLVWSTTWHAITWQIVQTPAALGVALRFALAGTAVLVWAAVAGRPLHREVARWSPGDHLQLAVQGICLYGLSYVCVYRAEQLVASGLVAVGFSAAPLATGLGGRVLFGTPMSRRFTWGGVLGVAGVALMFWPRQAGDAASAHGAALAGAGWTAAAVALSAGGALSASRNRARGLPMWPSLGIGMWWGAASAGVVLAGSGAALHLPTAPSWWGSLVYLALVGSVLTFACYLTLQDRVGAGRTAAVGVMTPVLALVVSTALEGYRADALALAGIAVALVGNALMLLRAPSDEVASPRPPATDTAAPKIDAIPDPLERPP